MKQVRLYSLYQKIGGRWVQIAASSFPKKTAVRVFQSKMLDMAMNGVPFQLRPTGEKELDYDALEKMWG